MKSPIRALAEVLDALADVLDEHDPDVVREALTLALANLPAKGAPRREAASRPSTAPSAPELVDDASDVGAGPSAPADEHPQQEPPALAVVPAPRAPRPASPARPSRPPKKRASRNMKPSGKVVRKAVEYVKSKGGRTSVQQYASTGLKPEIARQRFELGVEARLLERDPTTHDVYLLAASTGASA